MKKIPSRDITGKCDGECRDLVSEIAQCLQEEIKHHDYSGGPSSHISWADTRNEQPGFLGGHV